MNNLSPSWLIKFTSQSWHFGLKSQMQFWLTFHLKFHTTIATFSYWDWEVPWWFLIYVTVIYFKALIFNGPHVGPNPYAVVVFAVEHNREFLNNLHSSFSLVPLSNSNKTKKTPFCAFLEFGIIMNGHYMEKLHRTSQGTSIWIDMSVSKWWQIVHFCIYYLSIKYMYRKQT